MLSHREREQVVRAAVFQGYLTSGADFVQGRRYESLTQADLCILGDLGQRLALREPVVRAITLQDRQNASALFMTSFRMAYDHHLLDLTGGCQRGPDQLAADVFRHLEELAHGRMG